MNHATLLLYLVHLVVEKAFGLKDIAIHTIITQLHTSADSLTTGTLTAFPYETYLVSFKL